MIIWFLLLACALPMDEDGVSTCCREFGTCCCLICSFPLTCPIACVGYPVFRYWWTRPIDFPTAPPVPVQQTMAILNVEESSRGENEKYCSICLEALDSHRARLEVCEHEFHRECLESWIKIKQNCPMCRRP